MFWVSRASLGLARRKRLALGLMFDSCVCVRVCGVFILYIHNRQVLHRQLCECSTLWIAHPRSLCITPVCLLIAQSHCPNHFVLHDSRRDRLPRFPCLLPTPCERGTHVLLADCLCSGIAQSVENVLYVAWLPDRCMTASHLTSV